MHLKLLLLSTSAMSMTIRIYFLLLPICFPTMLVALLLLRASFDGIVVIEWKISKQLIIIVSDFDSFCALHAILNVVSDSLVCFFLPHLPIFMATRYTVGKVATDGPIAVGSAVSHL